VTQTKLEDLKGLSAEALKKLREEFYIYTVEDFLLRTRSPKKRAKIRKALEMDPFRLRDLRETAKGLMKSVKHVGVLYGWFETGTEGVVWSLIEDGKEGYEGLKIIDEKYDHLVVYGEDGKKLWSGKIKPDYKNGWRRYPLNPKFGQPCALGMWIHWTQKGW
jgi:hypothetical protein